MQSNTEARILTAVVQDVVIPNVVQIVRLAEERARDGVASVVGRKGHMQRLVNVSWDVEEQGRVKTTASIAVSGCRGFVNKKVSTCVRRVYGPYP